jgi:hypothetical protein
MKIKNLIIILLTMVFSLSLIAPSVWAGSTQRHRWEGVAIGLGAAIVGSALLSNRVYSYPAPTVVYRHPGPPRHGYYPPPRRRGHWEFRKVWVPPTYEEVWNPGHYDINGQWVPGRWIEIEKEPGYWTKEKVWVSKYHRSRPYDD